MPRQTLHYHVGGKRLPSVTEILAIAGVATDFERVPPDVLERARQRGADVAAWIEADHRGETLVPAPSIAGYVAAYRNFRDEVPFRVLACEEPVLHARYGYAGTLDLRGEEGHAGQRSTYSRWILDVKCTYAVPEDAGIQLAGYAIAVAGSETYRRGVLHLKPDGSWSRVEYARRRENDHDFLACLRGARWKLAHGLAQLSED